MAPLQNLDLIYSLIFFVFLYICYKLTRLNSSLPTNWPLLGMTPGMLWNFHHVNDYIANILKQNGGTFLYKGPWLSNRDILFTSDPANVRYISATNFHNYPKGPKFKEIFDVLGDGIFNADSYIWELHRKTTISVLGDAEFAKLLEKKMWNNMEQKLIPVLDLMSERGSATDLQDIFHRLTYDCVINLLIDYDPETLSVNLPYNRFGYLICKCEEALFSRHFLPKYFWKLQNRLQIGNEKNLIDAWKMSDELFFKFIKEKREMETNGVKKEQVDDLRFITRFMREYKDQTGSFGNPDKFIRDALLSLLIAGRDSTTSALTWFFYLIAKNPIAKGKIREEIHTQLGLKVDDKLKMLGTKELEKLVYLQGAIFEALRLFPPVPSNHKVPMEADTLPSGHQLQKNSMTVLHFYTMGRMETIWGQDWSEYKPERWLSENGGIKTVPSHKFTAFHTGPRACLGKKMSFMQMKIVAVTILNSYDIQLVEGHPIIQAASVLLQMKHGLMVKFTRRIDEVNGTS